MRKNKKKLSVFEAEVLPYAEDFLAKPQKRIKTNKNSCESIASNKEKNNTHFSRQKKTKKSSFSPSNPSIDADNQTYSDQFNSSAPKKNSLQNSSGRKSAEDKIGTQENKQTSIYLVRHGEVYNPEGILYGRLPHFHLSNNGRHMAEATAQYLKQEQEDGQNFVHIVASPLERAQETVFPIAQELGLDYSSDDNLIESDNKFEGQPVDSQTFFRPKNISKIINPFKPSWGEPYKNIATRMKEGIEVARRFAQDKKGSAIIVSHQLPIWVARLDAEGKKLFHLPTHRQCTLASVTRFDFNGDKLVNIDYIEPAAHLLQKKKKDHKI